MEPQGPMGTINFVFKTPPKIVFFHLFYELLRLIEHLSKKLWLFKEGSIKKGCASLNILMSTHRQTEKGKVEHHQFRLL